MEFQRKRWGNFNGFHDFINLQKTSHRWCQRQLTWLVPSSCMTISCDALQQQLHMCLILPDIASVRDWSSFAESCPLTVSAKSERTGCKDGSWHSPESFLACCKWWSNTYLDLLTSRVCLPAHSSADIRMLVASRSRGVWEFLDSQCVVNRPVAWLTSYLL